MRRLYALLRRVGEERGITLVELVTTMAILGVVLTGMTGLFVSGTKAQAAQDNRFQAQTQARVGLDKLRREVHGACAASTYSATSVTVTLGSGCATSVTWCTQGSGTRYGLYRVDGTTCTGGTRWADYLTTGNVFTFVDRNTPVGSFSLARLGLHLPVNVTGSGVNAYTLDDTVVFRNGLRQ